MPSRRLVWCANARNFWSLSSRSLTYSWTAGTCIGIHKIDLLAGACWHLQSVTAYHTVSNQQRCDSHHCPRVCRNLQPRKPIDMQSPDQTRAFSSAVLK